MFEQVLSGETLKTFINSDFPLGNSPLLLVKSLKPMFDALLTANPFTPSAKLALRPLLSAIQSSKMALDKMKTENTLILRPLLEPLSMLMEMLVECIK